MNDTEAIDLNTLRIWSHVTCVRGRAAGAAWCTSSNDCRRCTAVQSLLLLSAADGWQTFGVRAYARCHHHHRRCIPLVSGSTLPPPTQSSTAVGMRPRRRTRATVFKLISPVNADVAVWTTTTASAYAIWSLHTRRRWNPWFLEINHHLLVLIWSIWKMYLLHHVSTFCSDEGMKMQYFWKQKI